MEIFLSHQCFADDINQMKTYPQHINCRLALALGGRGAFVNGLETRCPLSASRNFKVLRGPRFFKGLKFISSLLKWYYFIEKIL
jgi:hypothetical protein